VALACKEVNGTTRGTRARVAAGGGHARAYLLPGPDNGAAVERMRHQQEHLVRQRALHAPGPAQRARRPPPEGDVRGDLPGDPGAAGADDREVPAMTTLTSAVSAGGGPRALRPDNDAGSAAP